MDQLVTSTLKKRKSRALGIRLLICYLKKKYIKLEDNVHIWLSLLCQSCNLSELRLYGDLIFSAMALLIDRIQTDGNLSKAFASTYLNKVLECLSLDEIYENDRRTLAALQTIKGCLKYYPKGIKCKKSLIEKVLLSLLDHNNVDVVHQTGKCWLLVQNVPGNCSKESFSDKTVWKDFQLSLLSNLQYIINRKLVITEERKDFPSQANIFAIFPFKTRQFPSERVSQSFQRVFNLIEYLKIALSEQFVFKKYIYSHQILDFIHNGLKVNSKQTNNFRVDHAYFESFLPKMHIKLLELLKILIEICYAHLRMDFRNVLNILMDALERTKSMLSAANRNQAINVRLILYRVISLWCSTLQEGSHCEIISETLVKEILVDLVPRNETLLSCRDESNLKNKCSSKTIFSMLEVHFDNNMLRAQAHFCLQQLLLSSGHLLKKQILKDVHNALLGICIIIHSEPTTKESLRNIWNCRSEVYKTFAFLLKLRNYECPTPLEIIMNLLNESRSFVNSNELRKSHNIYAPEHVVHPDKTGIQFKQGVDNFKFCHTNICDSENSKCLSLKDIAQSNIDDGKVTANENNLQNANKTNLNEISTKIVNNNAYEKHIIVLDKKSLNRDIYFKVENGNSPKEITTKDLLKKYNEMPSSYLSFKNDSLADFDNKNCNGSYINPGLASTYCSVEQCVNLFPTDKGTSDDAKMIADLEAIFVCELK